MSAGETVAARARHATCQGTVRAGKRRLRPVPCRLRVRGSSETLWRPIRRLSPECLSRTSRRPRHCTLSVYRDDSNRHCIEKKLHKTSDSCGQRRYSSDRVYSEAICPPLTPRQIACHLVLGFSCSPRVVLFTPERRLRLLPCKKKGVIRQRRL